MEQETKDKLNQLYKKARILGPETFWEEGEQLTKVKNYMKDHENLSEEEYLPFFTDLMSHPLLWTLAGATAAYLQYGITDPELWGLYGYFAKIREELME